MTKPRLTQHQKRVLADLKRASRWARDGWAAAADVGAPAGLEHLVDKGYAERQMREGPRGGRHLYYRPKEAA